ncbi:hypothetical protein ACIQMR_37010 [Streptomyces sp. NPDC091376]|uniref:hypothetical protein n=1 Tax=Streptomyces sp. NPDC091376 TaxID=3365994 RepID=UPI0038197AD6
MAMIPPDVYEAFRVVKERLGRMYSDPQQDDPVDRDGADYLLGNIEALEQIFEDADDLSQNGPQANTISGISAYLESRQRRETFPSVLRELEEIFAGSSDAEQVRTIGDRAEAVDQYWQSWVSG